MTRLEKCELLKSKGYTYEPETGKVFGVYGKEITSKIKSGYIWISVIKLLAHHFAWYMTYGNVDFIELDHDNRNRSDNRISNLRISNRNQQNQNRSGVKGYRFVEKLNKYQSRITFNNKQISLGYYDTKDEARQAYLIAKQKYHY
jgi:hypothetical protein